MNVIWRTTRSLGEGRRKFEVCIVKPPAANVVLVSHTDNPVELMSIVANTYNGVLQDYISEEEREKVLEDIKNTKLKTPTEMIHFVWLIENVSRAFTHQLVRYRVGTSFAQESMRFYGQRPEYFILGTGLTTASDNLASYGGTMADAIDRYEMLVDRGVPAQDARGLLPTNILTSIFFDCSLATLQNIFNQRMCCQAQHPEWLPVLVSMRKILNLLFGPNLTDFIKSPIERGEPCGYNASFDRPCTWKQGQQINEQEVLARI